MNEKEKMVVRFIFILLIITCVIYVTLKTYNTFSRVKYKQNNISIVDSYNTFFAIQNAANNFLVQSKDEVISDLVDDEQRNLSLRYNSPDYSIIANRVEMIKMKKNYAYLLTGKVIKTNYESIDVVNPEYQMIIFYDYKNLSYSVYLEPENFLDIVNKKQNISIKLNSNNKIPTSKAYSPYEICNAYFEDFMRDLLYNRKVAYENLSEESLERFEFYENFNNYVKEQLDNYSLTMQRCSLVNDKSYKIYDTNGNGFVIDVNAIMHYKVNIK